jgi:hypothetical protein
VEERRQTITAVLRPILRWTCVTDEQQVARTRERFMTRFSVGEQVIIRYGRHQGQKATVLKSLPDYSYRVKAEDGTVLFFTSKGLEKERVQ